MKELKRDMVGCFIIWGVCGFNIANLVHLFTKGADGASILIVAVATGLCIAMGILRTLMAMGEMELIEFKAKIEALQDIINECEGEEEQE